MVVSTDKCKNDIKRGNSTGNSSIITGHILYSWIDSASMENKINEKYQFFYFRYLKKKHGTGHCTSE